MKRRLLMMGGMLFLLCAANAFAVVTPQNVVAGTGLAGASASLTFDLNVTVATAPAANAVIRYSSDASCTSGDNFLKYVAYGSSGNTTPLSLGVHSYTTTYTVPAGTPAGATRYVCVFAGTLSAISAPLTVGTPATPVVTPTAANVVEASVAQGGTANFDFTLTVTGAVAPAANAVVRISSDDLVCEASDTFVKNVAYASSGNTTPLSIGAHNYSTTASISLSTTPGTHRLCVFTSAGDAGDNFDVTSSTPVVETTGVTVDETSVAQGGTVNLNFTMDITNPPATAGNASIRYDATPLTDCSAGDTFLQFVAYSGADAQAFTGVDVTIPGGAALGTARLCVWTGTNWSASDTFEVVQAGFDNAPTNLRLFGPNTTARPYSSNPTPNITPATITDGDTLTVTFDVYNQGNVASPPMNATLRFQPDPLAPCSDDDDFLMYVPVPAIAADGSVTLTQENVPVGDGLPVSFPHKICVKVDDDEDEEMFVIGPLPDLVPVNISVTPNPVPECAPASRTVRTDTYVGCTADLSFNVYNQGKASATGISHVRAYVSDYPSLAGGHILGTENDVELMITGGPCVLPSSRIQADALIQTDNCVDALAAGELSGAYGAQITIPPGVFGSYNLGPGDDDNGATRNENGTFHMVAHGYPSEPNSNLWVYSYVSWVPGRYVWVVVDSEPGDESGQELDELEANDAQNTFLAGADVYVSDIEQISASFYASQGIILYGSPRLSILTDGTASCGGCNPNIVALLGPSPSWAGDTNVLNSYCGANLAESPGIGDDVGRWDDSHLGGSPYTTFPLVVSRQGGLKVKKVTFVFDGYDSSDVTLNSINLNASGSCP